MERKKRSKGRGWESCYVKTIYGTFGVEMRAYGQKLVQFCTHTHTRVSFSSIDCCQIWSQYKKGTVRKLQVGYNHAFRRIMKYDITCSASGMFVVNNVMSFNEIWRKSLYNFKQRTCYKK